MSKQHVDPLLSQLPSGRHGLPREYVRASQRTRLIDAAIHVAGTDGYVAMTVTAITARAGVSRKTFYEFFADRESCFLVALDTVLERARDGARAAQAAAAGEPWSEQLRAVLTRALDALADHPQAARIAFVEVLAAGPEALRRRAGVLDELAAVLAGGRALAPRHVAVPERMPLAIAGAFDEVVRAFVAGGRAGALPELLPDLMYCALAPFTGPAEAAGLAGGVPAPA